MRKPPFIIILVLALLVSAQAGARETIAQPAIIGLDALVHPTLSREGMVASSEETASRVGARVLAAGGNAIDAAVATGFALAVTYPMAGNLGGGGFMMIHLASDRRTIAVDFREMAPRAALRDMFLDADGKPDPQKSRYSHLATGVPGTVAGLLHVHEKYGRLSREAVLKPAIELAEHGYPLNFFLASSLSGPFGKRLLANAAAKAYYFKPDGSPYAAGEILRQPDLAATLRRIAKHGRAGFYQGPVADAIVNEMRRGGGLITHEDLEDYTVAEREPVIGHFRGYEIATMPPPSSGGVHLVQMLNVLDGFALAEMGHNSARYLHVLTETMKHAYADRSKHLGDPDFYPVPARELTSLAYARKIREAIDPERAVPSEQIAPTTEFPAESSETTHFSVMDIEGNVVSSTYTLNGSFGNGVAVPGAGFLLNNEMDDFSAKPGAPNMFGLIGGEANAVAPRKRPLSSMTPTIVLSGDKPVLATGAPGGSRIITVVLQIVLNNIVFDMNIADAVARPRIHHQWEPDLLYAEPGISPDTLERLQSMGHAIGNMPFVLGNSQSVAWRDGFFRGASDTRRPGGAVATVEEIRLQSLR